MFGNLGQLAGLLKNAGQIKENMKAAAQRLKEARIVGDAGGGQVQTTVDGSGEAVSVRIAPELFATGDRELIEELVCASFRDAIVRSREVMQKEFSQAAGGIDLSSMMGALGQ